MPANLSPEYKQAEEQYRAASTPEARLAALELMLSAIPKHKGTEKMQAELKRRISKFRAGLSKKSGAARQKPIYHVDREGAGQIALVGPPNSGKSSLLDALTGADPEIADYPFTTRLPQPGMAACRDVQLQLVDLPPVAAEGSPPWLPTAIRMADLVALVVDAGDDEVLTAIDEVRELVAGYGIKLGLRTTPDRREMNTVVVAARSDLDPGGMRFELIRELVADLPLVPATVRDCASLDRLVSVLYDALGIVRMFTRAPGKKADLSAPFILQRGATVVDAARAVHKDIAANLKSAKLWNDTTDGLYVARDYEIQDGDIIEFRS